MYYEERLIDGILHWRGTPDGEWQIIPAEKLGERVIAAEAFRATVAEALAALRAELNSEIAYCSDDDSDYDEGVQFAMTKLDETITALNLAHKEG